MHIFLLCLWHLLFPAAVHFNPCLIFRSFHCLWDLRGTNFHALIQSGRMSIANLRFRASRSIWRTRTKKRKQNESSGSRMLPCIISLKLTGVAQLLVETCIRKNHIKSKDLMCKWKVFTVCVILGCLIEGPMINRKEECPYIHLLAGTSDICACHDQVILFCQLKCKASRQ
jgi:hypothetical protein